MDGKMKGEKPRSTEIKIKFQIGEEVDVGNGFTGIIIAAKPFSKEYLCDCHPGALPFYDWIVMQIAGDKKPKLHAFNWLDETDIKKLKGQPMSKRNIQTAERLEHPMLVAACQARGPSGFSPLEQHVNAKNVDQIRKRLLAKHGDGNIHIEDGHFQLFKEGKNFKAVHFKNGVMIFLRNGTRAKARRKIMVNGKEEEAGDPDWSRDCVSCGARPIEPKTGRCGLCCFGEWKTQNGEW